MKRNGKQKKDVGSLLVIKGPLEDEAVKGLARLCQNLWMDFHSSDEDLATKKLSETPSTSAKTNSKINSTKDKKPKSISKEDHIPIDSPSNSKETELEIPSNQPLSEVSKELDSEGGDKMADVSKTIEETPLFKPEDQNEESIFGTGRIKEPEISRNFGSCLMHVRIADFIEKHKKVFFRIII